MATLSVYFEQRRVGTIDIDKNGPGFTYDPGWVGLKGAFSISITMPLRSERIASDTFLPWAANLLPESVQLRTLGQFLGMAPGDVIGPLRPLTTNESAREQERRLWRSALFGTRPLFPELETQDQQIVLVYAPWSVLEPLRFPAGPSAARCAACVTPQGTRRSSTAAFIMGPKARSAPERFQPACSVHLRTPPLNSPRPFR